MSYFNFTSAIIVATVSAGISVHANAAQYSVDKTKSSVKFVATMNNSPVTGEFKDYDAKIDFDPNNLDKSTAFVDLKPASITASYDEVASTLQGDDWFAAKKFPDAKFQSVKFVKLGENNYEVDGNLTIRDKTNSVPLKFTLKQVDAKHSIVDAETIIKRSDYGVGQGAWKDTSSVKDEVKISIHLEAASN